MKPALFLDRDGTINEDLGYIYKKKDLIFIPGALETLRELQKYFLLFIITNQAGIGYGYFSEQDFIKFNKYFLETLAKENIKIEQLYYCPHTNKDGCQCRKPSTFFIEQACQQYDIDLKKSYMIGDHPSDIELAKNAGIKSIYVLSGHGQKHQQELICQPDHIAASIKEITNLIT